MTLRVATAYLRCGGGLGVRSFTINPASFFLGGYATGACDAGYAGDFTLFIEVFDTSDGKFIASKSVEVPCFCNGY